MVLIFQEEILMRQAIIKYKTQKNGKWKLLRTGLGRPMIYKNKIRARNVAFKFKTKDKNFIFRVVELS